MRQFETTQEPAKPHATRTAHFNAGDASEVPVFGRSALQTGMRIEGPAIIEEKTSTTVLYPGQRGTVDEYLNIQVELPDLNVAARPSPR
jgi:N-methylhydantoinase A